MGRELCEILQDVSDGSQNAKVEGSTNYQGMISTTEAMISVSEAFQSGMDYALSNCVMNIDNGSNS